MTIPTIELNDGSRIPQLGFGVFQIDPDETAEAVTHALEAGYRHIDTAEMYGNEEGVGEAIRDSGIDRDEIWVTSKLNNGFHEPDDARRAFDDTLVGARLRPRRPVSDPLAAADALRRRLRLDLEDARGVPAPTGGRARSASRTSRSTTSSGCAPRRRSFPAVNQIELHPYFQNREVAAYGLEHGIATESWSPIAQGKVLDDEAINEIAERLDRSPAQVVLRWHVEHGYIVFPKSVTPERIRENLDLFDFELTAEDVERIDALDRGEAGGPVRTRTASTTSPTRELRYSIPSPGERRTTRIQGRRQGLGRGRQRQAPPRDLRRRQRGRRVVRGRAERLRRPPRGAQRRGRLGLPDHAPRRVGLRRPLRARGRPPRELRAGSE